MTGLTLIAVKAIRGFNPCFGGSHIVTIVDMGMRLAAAGFQSLFWWISYCDNVFRLTYIAI